MPTPGIPPSGVRFTPAQRKLFVFLSAATFFEGYDFMAISQVLPALRADMDLSKGEGATILGAAAIGPVLAALLMRKVDRWGRRRVLMITLVGYAIASFVTGLTQNPLQFTLVQIVAQMFLIAEWGTSMVYAAEAFPAAQRGAAVGAIQAMASFGAVACAGLVPLMLRAPWGWRTVFFIGGVPLLLLALARRNLPETDRFKALQAAETPPNSFLRILGPDTRRRVFLLATLWGLVYAATHTAIKFWKDFAISERDFTEMETARTLTIAAVVAMPMVFGVGRLLDRVGRRVGAAILFPLAALAILGGFTAHDHRLLTVCVVGIVFGASAVLPVLETYTAELFPTDLRGDAFAWSNNLLGRLGSVGMPWLIALYADAVGYGVLVAGTSACLILALWILWTRLPETASKELEEISA